MKGLSKSIEDALETTLEGLNYSLSVDDLDADKMKATMKSKMTSFQSAKKLLYQWENSPNSPSPDKLTKYIKRLIIAGDMSLDTIRKALSAKIDYRRTDESRHYLAIETKPFLLETLFELEASVIELRNQVESGNIRLKEDEYERGYAEKFANQEFFPEKDYYKKPVDEDKDPNLINICPFGTRGEIFELEEWKGLKVQIGVPPTDPKKILFSDLPIEEQYWKREELPKGLTVHNHLPYYDWIMEQFRRRREGVWFMNAGVPTYLTPRHWMQLQWGKMLTDGIYPGYRESQRDLKYHQMACELDYRCMGEIFVKSRQTGYTYGIVSDSVDYTTSHNNVHSGLTSMTESDAKKAFEKQAYIFREWPFFFQPVTRGRADSTTKLDFGKPSDLSKKARKTKDTTSDGYVNSSMDYEATKTKAYDGQSLKRLISDEAAKWDRASYIEHLNTVLPVLFRGGKIQGKAWLGSTMGKLDEGGEEYKTLYLASAPKNRLESGYTATKLYSHFMPAHKNYEMCIDKYGRCWEETPPPGTYNMFGDEIKKGSIQMITDLYKEAMLQGDVALNAIYRAYPMTEEHAMRDEAESCVFNLTKLQDQFDHNEAHELEKTTCVRGNFSWVNGKRFSQVEWNPDPRGRFNVWWMPGPHDGTTKFRNKVKNIRGFYHPENDYAVIGVDSFGSYVQGKNKFSKGAAHAFSREDSIVAPPRKFLFEYIDKPPTQDDFNEDILMAMWFYGIKTLPENNQKDFVKYLYIHKCRGFVMNRVDKSESELSGDDKVLGGQPMTGKDMLARHENAIRSHIQKEVGVKDKEAYRGEDVPMGTMGTNPFQRTISGWMKFDPKNRTKSDETISSGLAIVGANVDHYRPEPKKTDPKKNVSLLRKYSNKGNIGTFIKR